MIVILYNIRSLHNVGSIFRTADAANCEKIYLCGITPAPIDRFHEIRPQFAKVSLGAEKFVKWEKRQAIWKVIEELKQEGHKIFAIEQNKKSIPYYKLSKSQITNSKRQIALILGSEAGGLTDSILKRCDKILEIPMRGKMMKDAGHPKTSRGERRGKESLNVSVAFGIVVYSLLENNK